MQPHLPQLSQFDLIQFPYLTDFEPKKREIMELVSETGEALTQSSSSLNVRKGTTSTDSTENVDIDRGGSFGLSVTTPKGGGGISSSQQQEVGTRSTLGTQGANVVDFQPSRTVDECKRGIHDVRCRFMIFRKILSAQGVPADALGKAIADILRNEPPASESHPDFALNDRLSSSATGDPVIIFSGQFSLTLVDVQFPAFGFPIRLTRTYRSGPAYFGPWGFNWDHNYNLYLRELNGGGVAVWTGALREDVYAPSPDGFEPPPGFFCRLELDTSAAGGDRYILTDAAGNRQIFARPVGWPRADRIPALRLENRQGDGLDLTYDAEGRLQSVADPARRFLRFTYGDCALLEAVTDHTGRSWLYVHDSDIEHLIAVTTPPTAEYPQGLTSSYEYDRFRAHPALVHNIVRVLDPDGQTVVENRYGDDPGTDDFGRVVFQNYGGFEAVFAATRLQFAPRDPAAINIPTLRVEVVDPGILGIYTFNPLGDLLDERYRLALDGTFRLAARTYRYDEQGNTILRHEPNGLTLASTYDTGNPDPRARGNVLRMVLQPPPTVVAADREIMRATYEGRHNQIKRLIDEGGSMTTLVYDYEETAVDRGNVIRVELPDSSRPLNEQWPPRPRPPWRGSKRMPVAALHWFRRGVVRQRPADFPETINEPVAEVFQKFRKVLKLSIRL